MKTIFRIDPEGLLYALLIAASHVSVAQIQEGTTVVRPRGQTLTLRIAPHGTGNERDVPVVKQQTSRSAGRHG